MRHTKKAQLESMMNWIIALVLIFTVFITFMIWNKPWQQFDNLITPKIEDYQAGGKDIKDLPPIFRRNQALLPVIFMATILLWAFLSSLRQDPNYPYE